MVPRPGLSISSTVTSSDAHQHHLVLSAHVLRTSPRPPLIASALVDSGATANFIDANFVQQHSLPRIAHASPLLVTTIDGRPLASGPVTYYASLSLRLGSHTFAIALDIVHLGLYPIVLGLPFLRSADPDIDWARNHVVFRSSSAKDEPRAASSLTSAGSDVEATAAGAARSALSPSSLSAAQPILDVDFVDVDDFEAACDSPSSLLGTIVLQEPSPPSATLAATSSSPPDSEEYLAQITALVPPQYHDLLDAFSKAHADTLPPHRPYDLAIELEPGATAPYGPIYPLSDAELKALSSWLDENLAKGFIRPSRSPAGSPILFVKKGDGSLRLCVDYRALNRVTIKNRHPLPLISELLDRLRDAKVYTKLDLRSGYNLVRIKEGHEWLTAFRTRYGHFESLVMPFGLTNAPAVFQHLINDVFRDLLDVSVLAYLDDILIFSRDPAQHDAHVREVLRRLIATGLYCNPKKCEFSTTRTDYLGFTISPDGIHMSERKIQAVLDWPLPTNVREVRQWLGFCSFYRRFIARFADVTRPLTRLLEKDTPFALDDAAIASFRRLQQLFTTAPVLRHFDPDAETIIETDASDFAIAAILSQRQDQRLHPIAFLSHKLSRTEIKWDVRRKELYAIVAAVEEWRHYLDSSRPFTIITDHRTLEHFSTARRLERPLHRWALKLGELKYTIVYRPGKEGEKADALSRRPDLVDKDKTLDNDPVQVLRPVSTLSATASSSSPTSSSPAALAATTRSTARSASKPTSRPRSSSTSSSSSSSSSSSASTAASSVPQDTLSPPLSSSSSLIADIAKSLQHDPAALAGIAHARSTQPQGFSLEGDLLLLHDRIYIPDSEPLKVRALQLAHDSQLAGHPGIHKTLATLSRHFIFPGLRSFVRDYIRSCDVCQRAKPSRHRTHGLLHSLPTPSAPWLSISMDHIVELPLSRGYDCVLVVVDRLTKEAHFIPTRSTDTSRDLAQQFRDHVFRLHGFPSDIVSDRGATFTSSWWIEFLKLIDTKPSLSTAFHPESDGQTERLNAVLEQYLRCFIDYLQDDWVDHLATAELSYNTAHHSAIGMSPFFASRGYQPRLDISLRDSRVPDVSALAARLRDIQQRANANIKAALARYSRYADRKRMPAPQYKVGDLVMLVRRHIRTTRPSSKLDFKKLGPFKVSRIINPVAVRLALPPTAKIHPTFHVSLLEPYRANSLPSRRPAPPPPTEIHPSGEEAFEVEAILDSRIRNRQLQYFCRWLGYGPEEDTWTRALDFDDDDTLVLDFHRAHPDKPGSERLRSARA